MFLLVACEAPLLPTAGRRAEPWALRFLTPGAIERVEVIKGAAAALRYPDPAARNGAILIFTRTPAASPP